jgi:4-amino-4-deoxy-L-arabinose transferase-like glycosyltransferase
MTIMPLFMLGPEFANGTLDSGYWAVWLIPAGIVFSVGLAIGAGFCSFFPQLAWCVLAAWALSLVERGGFPEWHSYLLYIGMGLCIAMLGLQFYRVRTGAFVPTLPADDPDFG